MPKSTVKTNVEKALRDIEYLIIRDPNNRVNPEASYEQQIAVFEVRAHTIKVTFDSSLERWGHMGDGERAVLAFKELAVKAGAKNTEVTEGEKMKQAGTGGDYKPKLEFTLVLNDDTHKKLIQAKYDFVATNLAQQIDGCLKQFAPEERAAILHRVSLKADILNPEPTVQMGGRR